MQTPLFGFNAARPLIVDEVVSRVTKGCKDPLLLLSEAAYVEMRRLPPKSAELAEWRALAGTLGKMSDAEGRAKLEHYARKLAWDVAGNFDPRIYRTVSRAAAPIVSTLLKPRHAVRNLMRVSDLASLDDRVVVKGPVDDLRALAALGTLVFVPTHLSNLDSVVFGFALERSELPPATYGAGKNLFENPVLSFFMHNLGAYRVDRRLKFTLYKEVLKAYSCVLVERGYHSLFFPGGTRSRSGAVERHLKLGLAGTGVEAYARTVLSGRPQRVFFVPATINYLLTLEAETLIDDYLKEEGKHRYIIDDDESTRVGRIASFMNKLLGLDGSVVIRFCPPLDPFGNRVDERGRSYDARGRPVDPKTYLFDASDTPVRDPARDAQYTRELGTAIVGAFRQGTVVMATHVVAAAAFRRFRRAASEHADLFGLLRHRDDVVVPRGELQADVGELLDRLRDLANGGELHLASQLEHASPADVLDEALRAFTGYHTEEVLAARGSSLVLSDPRLLLYYQNRLVAHGLGAASDLEPSYRLSGRAGLFDSAAVG